MVALRARSARLTVRKAVTVEDCLGLDVNQVLTGRPILHRRAYVRFDRPYLSGRSDGDQGVYLRYSVADTGEQMRQWIRLQMTRPRFGGVRWWLTCPLYGLDGNGCKRRVTKL